MAANSIIRPMLAATFEEKRTVEHLRQDGLLLVEPKIDGMRVLHDDGKARSRSWKLWTNVGLQAFAAANADLMHGWDGEILPGIIAKTPTAEAFRTAMSDVRSSGGDTNFTYYLFDNYDVSWAHYPFWVRYLSVYKDLTGVDVSMDWDVFEAVCYRSQDIDDVPYQIFAGAGFCCLVKLCPTYIVRTMEELYALEQQFLDDGFEGAIIRRKGRGYKWNRSTALEGSLTKLKRFEDFEAVIDGVYAREHNANEATVSALGYTARSAHKDNKVALECVGGFNCHLLEHPEIKFDVGVLKGLDMGTKEYLWTIKEQLPGRIITCVEQGYKGGYDKPRTPVFHRFRDPIEL